MKRLKSKALSALIYLLIAVLFLVVIVCQRYEVDAVSREYDRTLVRVSRSHVLPSGARSVDRRVFFATGDVAMGEDVYMIGRWLLPTRTARFVPATD